MVSSGRISISVFFPCHNEEGSIEALTRKTLKVLSQISDDYEVIIVDDGSKDQTPVIAERLATEDEHVNLIPPILEAVRIYATVGEICDVLRSVFGEYRPAG